MFSRILIANRGEIALRIIRTCKRLGIETVVTYSQADRDALYLGMADHTICIGPPHPARSYLYIKNIIAAAEIADVEAIHPGYGFLSEDAHFADVCRSCKIAFVGPSVEAMELMGNKVRARKTAMAAGVPVVPGSESPVASDAEAREWARKIGYPVLIKAAMGGGGRGMRVAHNDASLSSLLNAARAEAHAAFGDGTLYIEKYIENPRHIEVQILADEHGSIIHLGERDCTVQRRHQKMIEEAPSPALDRHLRADIAAAAVKLMKAAKYTNAGTVEFLYDPASRKFYFIEVNARLQVEHPVTEMVTGLDLVEEQLRIASGERLRWRQKDIQCAGWAMECRINAEDPYDGFRPCPGVVARYVPPSGPGVREDSHLYSGYTVPPYYDSLLAKLIVHGRDRSECIQKMRGALEEFILDGVKTTIPILKEVFEHVRFIRGNYDTRFIENEFKT
ncbi:MAG: acetyl-CoA carboxylase biotin carboxylase subunit [Planctomycetota bacterium]|nr:acetyl-CoA carboxylase biotin carboxylase subunit [Planctomycetota bacterium]